MAIEANIVFLEEEIKNIQERIDSSKMFLKKNPSVSIYCRLIKGKKYYYKKYRQDGESVSKFLGNEKFDHKKAKKKVKAENEKIGQTKERLSQLKKEIVALKKQLKIAKKVFEHV